MASEEKPAQGVSGARSSRPWTRLESAPRRFLSGLFRVGPSFRGQVTTARLAIDLSDSPVPAEIDLALPMGLVVIGFVSGVLAGLMGVGGGIVIVPALVIMLGLSAASAKQTSLARIDPTAVVWDDQNKRRRNIDLRFPLSLGSQACYPHSPRQRSP